jgi:hypothetical protein
MPDQGMLQTIKRLVRLVLFVLAQVAMGAVFKDKNKRKR